MSNTGKRDARRRLSLYLYLSGAAVLAAGFIAAAVVYLTVTGAAGGDLGAGFEDYKGTASRYERLGGATFIAMVEFVQWFGGLWHGTQLAETLVLLSIGIALVCFVIAHRLAFGTGHEHGEDDRG
jgi:hypothetical protein